jgi:iron complex outermembrane receptor protein
VSSIKGRRGLNHYFSSNYLRAVGERAHRTALIFISVLVAGAGSCFAEELQPDVLQEVVVTAQHRAEDLQTVPVAVTAFTQEELDRFRFAVPTELASQTPSLEIKGTQGESKPNVFLRGVGNNDFNATASNAVGFYTDQVYQGLPSGQLFQMFDLERVEVLRGPQGTLYGRNTTGGAINFISHQPDGTFGGDVSVSLGQYDERDAEAAVQFGLTETLSTRLAGNFRHSQGDTINLWYGTHVGGNTSSALRDILRWKPTDNQTWTLNMHVARYDGDGPRYHFIPLDNGLYPDSVLPLIGVTPPYRETDDWWAGKWDLRQAERVDSFGSSVIGEINLGFALLTTITAYETVDAYTRYDSDASPLDYVDVVYADKSWMASEEVRLASQGHGPLSWITGVYFYRDFITSNNTFDIAHFARTLFGQPPDPNDPTAPAYYVQHWTQPTRSFAVFASGTYEFSPAWKATLGARWTQDHKSIDYHTFQDESATIGIIPLIDVGHENTWSDVTGNASIQYSPSKAAMLYASFNRGFKSGAYNGSPFFDADAVRAVDPEYVNAYEVGAKTQWFGNRLLANLALFYNDYKNLQVFRFVPDPNTGVPTAFLDNAASATIKGVELELHARPGHGLDIELGMSYLDAKYKDYVVQQEDPAAGTPAIDYSGNKLVGAPEFHVNAVAEYTFNLGDAYRLVPRAEYVYNTTTYYDSSNNPILSQGAYGLLNLALRLENIRKNWNISAWLRNATGKEYSTDALDLSNFGFDISVHGAKRTAGVTMEYRFD